MSYDSFNWVWVLKVYISENFKYSNSLQIILIYLLKNKFIIKEIDIFWSKICYKSTRLLHRRYKKRINEIHVLCFFLILFRI